MDYHVGWVRHAACCMPNDVSKLLLVYDEILFKEKFVVQQSTAAVGETLLLSESFGFQVSSKICNLNILFCNLYLVFSVALW